MTVESSSHRAELAPQITFERPVIRRRSGDESVSIRIRLREALARIESLLVERDELIHELAARREGAANHVAGLSPRQRQVMDMVLAGHASKIIAWELGISQRTVENHRASIMKRTGTRCVAALARLALAAAGDGGPGVASMTGDAAAAKVWSIGCPSSGGVSSPPDGVMRPGRQTSQQNGEGLSK
jgi:DNA-binding CsgD family transcriptional regulator